MKRENDQHLWDLLGHAAQPQASPFFARNVLRQIREQPRWSPFSWLSWGRLVPVSGLAAALALVAFFALNNHPPRQNPADEEDLIAKIDVQDYEVVADLDELLASDENNLWDENLSL
jgi:hypothetical protein